MEKEFINPPGLFRHFNYTRIITVRGPAKLIYMSGQTPSDENYKAVHPGDLAGQYRAILEILTKQLKAAGATWADVVSRRTYVLDMPAYMEILRNGTVALPWKGERPPVSTSIGVTALSDPEFLIEVEIVAIIND